MKRLLKSFRRDDVTYVTKWQKRYKYYMGLLCWAVGLNDFMEFSTIMLDFGIIGLIPAFASFAFFIIPVGFIEMAIGQFSRCSYIKVWSLSPPFRGLGLTCLYLLAICTLHFNLLNIVILEYFVGSLQPVIPWFDCEGTWAQENCFVFEQNTTSRMRCNLNFNQSYCDSLVWENSAEHYWSQIVSVDVPVFSTSKASVKRMLYSLTTSSFLFIMLRKGIRSIEFFVPVLAIVPHVLQLLLFLTTVVLRGTERALSLFYIPKPNKLANFTMWGHIVRRTLSGTNVGLGGNILFGSESADFRTPIHMATVGVYTLDFVIAALFAMLCTNMLAIFSYNSNINPEDVYNFKSGLFFRRLSLVFKTWPWFPQLWCGAYFLSLYIINTRTKVLILHACLSGVYELFPKLKHYSDLCSFVAVLVDLLLSFIYFTKKSLERYETRMTFFNNSCTILVILYETVIISFIYGTHNLIDDIHFMLGFRPSAFWKSCWYASPVVSGILVYISTMTWGRRIETIFQEEDIWFLVLLVTSLAICTFFPLVYMIYYLCRYRHHKKCAALLKPSSIWGPPDARLRRSREMFSAHSMTKEYMYRQQRTTRQFIVDAD